MKLSSIAFSAIIASTSAQEGPRRLRYRVLKPEASATAPIQLDLPDEIIPLPAQSSMSIDTSMSIEIGEWGTELEQLDFDSSLSLSMSTPPTPVKCDKKCQKEQMKAEAAAEAQFAEWGAEALTPFAFDASMSFSMSSSMPIPEIEPVKCDKKCQKEKLKDRQRRKLSVDSSMSLSMSLSADFEWAEPDLDVFEFDMYEGSLSYSMSTP